MYPVRGIADLWDHSSHCSRGGLNKLIGDSCANAVALLQIPRTTLDVAATLGLSSAATSEQITKLWRVGLLERTRVGRRVFYTLNEKGKLLLTTFCT